MVIGVQKCGTTSLAFQLSQHPEIAFCEHKEPDFFSKKQNWKNQLDSYHNLFNALSHQILGEASTTYSWFLEYHGTPNKIYEYNSNIKFIYVVRDPVERMRSHFLHELSKGRVKLPLEEELLQKPTYLHHSLYAAQIRPFLNLFPFNHFFFIKFEDYVENTLTTLKELAIFLKIKPEYFENIDLSPKNEILKRKAERRIKNVIAPYVRFIPLNVRSSVKWAFEYQLKEKPEFSEGFKKRLWNLLRDDAKEFSRLSGINISDWEKKYEE